MGWRLMVLVICCSGCGTLQLMEDVRSVVNPTYAGSAISASRIGSPRQWIVEESGKPNASAMSPDGRRIDTYVMTQHSESEGLTFHFRRASVLFYDRTDQLQAVLWPTSKDQFKQIEAFARCCRRLHEDSAGAYTHCMPAAESDFKKRLLENGEVELREARRCATRPYNRESRARDASPYYRAALGNFEVAEGGASPRLAEIIEEWSALLKEGGRLQEAEAVRRRAANHHQDPTDKKNLE